MPITNPWTEAQVDALVDAVRAKADLEGIGTTELARATGFSKAYVSQLLNKSRDDRGRNAGPVLVLAHAVGLAQLVDELR